MGEIIIKKVKGMNWKAKIALVLMFTLVFSTFLHQGLYSPRPAQAAITYQAPGAVAYSAAGGATVAPAYPATTAAGNLLVLIVGMKPGTANTGSVTTPAGWTPIVSLTGAGGYGATLATDTGNTNLFTYYTVAAGTETGSLTVTINVNGATGIAWAQIYRLTKTEKNWDVAGATGSQIVGGNVSLAFSSDPGVTTGDFILGAMCIPTDITTPAQFTTEAFTQTGATFAAGTEISEPDSALGNQVGGFVAYTTVTAGTGTANPTMTATAAATTTNVRGPGVFIRIRALTYPSTNTSCASCHDYTPTFVDGTARNTPVGQFPGSHKPHVQDNSYACSVCHVVPATETSADFKHRTGTIQFRDPINGNANARYSKASGAPYSFAQTNAAFTGGTCSVTYCHGTNSGTWGTNAPTIHTCTKCHGRPVATGAYVLTDAAPGSNGTGVDTANELGTVASNVSNDAQVGAHDSHLRALSQYTNAIACNECHSVPATVAAVGHNDSALPADPTWGTLATNSGVVIPTYVAGGGNCTNYCHGVNLVDGSPSTKTTPDWNTNLLASAGATDCGMCHGNPPNTGDHGGVSANVCNSCHPHVINSKTSAPFFQTSGSYSLASHINGVKDAQVTCQGCHSSRKGSPDQRAAIVGGAAGSEGDDFIRASRHVKNTTVLNVDCVICHAEGDVSSTEASPIRHATLHANQLVDLRNVDAFASVAVSWPGYRLVAKTISSANRDGMDTFCMNCHDSDASSATASQGGAYSISVNATNNGITTGGPVARRLTPFNTGDGGSPLDVRGQFNRTNAVGKAYASHHQLNQFTGRYTAAYQTANSTRGGWTGTSKDGVAIQWATKLHCSDCHLNEANAHGSRNTIRMLQNSSGADTAFVNVGDGTGTFVCYKCHQSAVYNSGAASTLARLTHGDFDSRPFGAGFAGDARQIICMNCHGGAGIGNIHGNNRTITTTSQGSTKSYRFMYGAELGLNISEANWETTVQPSCYTSGTTWGGSCTSHNGATNETGRIGAPNYSRPLQ